jgi:hypothetical protein
MFFFFYILLTVHLVMILGKWPTWRTVLFYMCLFQFSTCFEQPRAHRQENQLYQYNIWYMSLCLLSVTVSCAGRKVLSDLHAKWSPTVAHSPRTSWPITSTYHRGYRHVDLARICLRDMVLIMHRSNFKLQ